MIFCEASNSLIRNNVLGKKKPGLYCKGSKKERKKEVALSTSGLLLCIHKHPPPSPSRPTNINSACVLGGRWTFKEPV